MIRNKQIIENKQLEISFNALKVAHEYLINNKTKLENALNARVTYDIDLDDMSVSFFLLQPCKCCRVYPGIKVKQVTENTFKEILDRLEHVNKCREEALKHKVVIQMEYDKHGDMIFNEDLIGEPVTNIAANFVNQFK